MFLFRFLPACRGNATKCSPTDHNPVGEDEELHVGSEGTEHQAAGHHHPAEDGHGTGAEVLHADAADGTWEGNGRREKSVKKKRGVGEKCRGYAAKTPPGPRLLTRGASGQDAAASH